MKLDSLLYKGFSVGVVRLGGVRCCTCAVLLDAHPALYNFLYVGLGSGGAMRTVSYSEVRQNLAKMLDHVVDDAEEVVITRSGHESAVIISLREYESLKETAYLMASPANARRLNEAVEELRNGGGEVRDLLNPDEASAA